MQTPGFAIRRAKEARAQFGIAQSTFYDWQERGLMPPGIALGVRSVGWPAHELDARNEPTRPGWGAIASVFANEDPDSDWTERRARETHKAALALAERGWRFIAARHPDLEEPRQKKKTRRPAK